MFNTKVYSGKPGNVYFYENDIDGQTDFFYGFSTAWIQSSNVYLRGCGSGMTARKGTNTTFVNKYGVYIHSSHIANENSTLSIKCQCALGRPWNAQTRSLFANTYLDDSIKPSGYIEWSATDPRLNYNTTMAEYQDYGPAFNLTAGFAANITQNWTQAQYQPYSSPELVFQCPFDGTFGDFAWIDTRLEA